MSVKILAVGDVCGEPGLDYLEKNLRNYRKENGIDFVPHHNLPPHSWQYSMQRKSYPWQDVRR